MSSLCSSSLTQQARMLLCLQLPLLLQEMASACRQGSLSHAKVALWGEMDHLSYADGV